MTKSIALLGSTGSIGRQALQVMEHLGIPAAALTGNRNTALLEQQARQFRPRLAVAFEEDAARDLKLRLRDTDIKVASGMEGLLEAATVPGADTVLTAVVGMVGLRPTLAAIGLGRRIALANKETLVAAGALVMRAAREHGAEIVPVDSEHSAIFQCLMGSRDRGEVRRLILTASGGPFYGKTAEELRGVTRREALNHPNWSMGAKITVDSATLMNKGLEVIEAMHLYGMPPEKISIVIHRESIIHSLVEFCDGAVLAQLGRPDMRLPIHFAFTYPDRLPSVADPLDLTECPPLTFGRPDPETFRCLGIALEAAKRPGTACAVMNGANEAAVGLFLRDRISFARIPELVAGAMERVPERPEPTLEEIMEADRLAREAVTGLL